MTTAPASPGILDDLEGLLLTATACPRVVKVTTQSVVRPAEPEDEWVMEPRHGEHILITREMTIAFVEALIAARELAARLRSDRA